MVANRLSSTATRREPSACLLCWLCLLLLAGGAHAKTVPLLDEELLITAVEVERVVVSQDLFVYYQPAYTLIPLQQFCELIGFPIEVDVDGESATGWFFDESTTFNLDLKQSSLYIGGQSVPVSADIITASDGFDLYINAAQLEAWFGLRLDLVTSQLTLKISSERPVPVIEKLRREKTRKLESGSEPELDVADVKNHYYGFALPVADFQMGTLLENTTTEEPRHSSYYALESSGDLLWHQMNLAVNGDGQTDTARVTFSRRAADNGAYMKFGFSDYAFGDVFTSGDTLINKGSGGVGFVAQRTGAGSWQAGFTEQLIEGDAPPGWEVELYRNGALIDFQISNEAGRYRFAGAPLQFGENVFDIKIYGPQGQQRTRRERVHVGPGMITPGEWRYQTSVMREHDALIGGGDNLQAIKDNADITFQYGLTQQHSVGFGWTRSAFASNREAHDYLKASLFSAWPLLSTRWDLAMDAEGGMAHNLGLSTRLFNQEFAVEHAMYDDFSSQRNPNGNISARTRLLWSGQFSPSDEHSVPLSLNLEQVHTADGGSRYVAKGLLSYSWDRFRFNSEANYNRSAIGEETASGSLNLNYMAGNWRYRANLSYALAPTSVLQRLTNTLDWESGQWRCQLRVDVGLEEDAASVAGIDLSRRFNFGYLSLSGEHADTGDYSLKLSYEYSFGMRASSPYVYGSSTRLSDRGRVQAHVFLDNNNNRVYDKNVDEPMKGVSFSGRKEWEQVKTDADGYAELFSFNAFANSRLTVDETSFNDPYLKAAKSSVLIAHHGGGYYRLAFPVGKVSELEGHVYLIQDGNKRAAGGVGLELRDSDGKLVDKMRSEFDGYYYLGNVLPGRYQLVLEDRIQNDTAYRVNTPLEIVIGADAEFVEVPAVIIESGVEAMPQASRH